MLFKAGAVFKVEVLLLVLPTLLRAGVGTTEIILHAELKRSMWYRAIISEVEEEVNVFLFFTWTKFTQTVRERATKTVCLRSLLVEEFLVGEIALTAKIVTGLEVETQEEDTLRAARVKVSN